MRKARVTSDGKIINDRLMTPTGERYKGVAFNINNKVHNKLVHRLVAEAFIPNPDNLPEVDHIDNDLTNNCAENLQWVTASANHAKQIVSRKNYSYRRKVVCLETMDLFDSISAAGRSVNADATQVVESIVAQRCCKGATFVYEDQMPDDPQSYMDQAHAKYQNFHRRPVMPNSRKVRIVETGQVFDSIAAAARFLNCDTATVSNRIKEHRTVNEVTLEFA